MTDPVRREQAVVELLDQWPWDLGGVIIGGYSVAAYGPPRYSDDLDVVVPASALEPLMNWLADKKFEKERVPDDLIQNYTGKVGRWRRDGITLDILPGAVRDREAQIDIPESWISRDARISRLLLIDASTRKEIPIVRPEALWALKLQAGRLRDLGDLFAIQDEPVDLDEVNTLFGGLWCEPLQRKLQAVWTSLDQEKTYRDTLSIQSRGSPRHKKNLQQWERFKRKVTRAIPVEPS